MMKTSLIVISIEMEISTTNTTMAQDPILSLIVPIYNVEKYLAVCLKSIQNQTLNGFECILVDDGSTDSSGLICDAVVQADSRFRVIHKQNGGLSDARNAGLREARGRYIGFIDGDDWIEPEMFRAMIGLAEKKCLDIVCSDVRIVNDKTRQSEPRKELCAFCGEEEVVSWKTEHCLLSGLNNISVCNKLFRADFLKKTGIIFPVGVRYEDIIFWSNVFFQAERISCIPRPFYNYRVSRDGSIVQKKDYRALPVSYQIKLDELRKHNVFDKVKDELTVFLVFRLVYCMALSRPEFRKEFFTGMKELLIQCVPFHHRCRQSRIVKCMAALYGFLARQVPYPLFLLACLPFFAMQRLSLIQKARRCLRMN